MKNRYFYHLAPYREIFFVRFHKFITEEQVFEIRKSEKLPFEISIWLKSGKVIFFQNLCASAPEDNCFFFSAQTEAAQGRVLKVSQS